MSQEANTDLRSLTPTTPFITSVEYKNVPKINPTKHSAGRKKLLRKCNMQNKWVAYYIICSCKAVMQQIYIKPPGWLITTF